MKCVRCGKENVPGIVYCEYCGVDLSASSSTPADTLKTRLLEIKGGFRDLIKKNNLGELLQAGKVKEIWDGMNFGRLFSNSGDPLTNLLIVFLAWGILNFSGLFRILAVAFSFLSGPLGLLVLLGLTYVYTKHREVIKENVEALKRGESLKRK